MANGLPYFPLDCHLDEKFEYIEAEFGLQGFSIIIKLFQRIYAGQGYYCEWNERVALLFAKRECGVDVAVVNKVVNAAIRERIFDEPMLKAHGVLTSKGIQRRFAEAARRRKQVFDKPQYVLIAHHEISGGVDNRVQNVNIQPGNDDISQQSKVKKSKVKNSKAEQSKAGTAAAAAMQAAEYEKHAASEAESAVQHSAEPYVKPAANAEPVTRESLVERYGSAAVASYEQRFNEWSRKQGGVRVEMYATIAGWMSKDNVQKPLENSHARSEVDEVMKEAWAKYAEYM